MKLKGFTKKKKYYFFTATVDIHTFWRYDLLEAKDAMKERKLQYGLDSDCSLTVMKGATLSSSPSIGLSGIQLSNHIIDVHR